MILANRKLVALAIVMMVVCASQARANYVISVEDDFGNNGGGLLLPGSTHRLNIVLSGSSEHIASEFTVVISRPGLVLSNFSWGDPYVTNGGDDVSVPQVTDLPTLLTADTYASTSAVDAKFSNFLGSGFFGTGTVLSFELFVPNNVPFALFDVSVGATFLNSTPYFLEDFDAVTIDAINGYSFSIVPEPASIAMFVVAGFAYWRKGHK